RLAQHRRKPQRSMRCWMRRELMLGVKTKFRERVLVLAAAPSQAEVAERRVIVRTAAERPMVFALALLDGQIVDAGEAHAHQAMCGELPVLVAVAAEPAAAVVVPFIGEAHGNPVVPKRPYLLDEPVIELAVPF